MTETTPRDPASEQLIRDVDELKPKLQRGFAQLRVAKDVQAERERQFDKWGDLHYPDGTGRPGDIYLAAAFKAICKANDPAADNWRDILAEEVHEAFAETDPAMLRAELIQIAAVAQAWAEDIDSRGRGRP
jgi:hypothetical protein